MVVYSPLKHMHRSIRTKIKMVIVLAWILALTPLLPSSIGIFGRYGLECKTRKCTSINMDYDGNPMAVDPKASLGSWTVVIAGGLLVGFNSAIYYRLWVKLFLILSCTACCKYVQNYYLTDDNFKLNLMFFLI